MLAGAQGIEFASEPKTAFTDSSPEKLGQTKRVAIAALVIEYQTLVQAEDITGFLGQRVMNRQNTYSQNVLAGFDVARLRRVADKAYERLAQDLKAAGYEVVPREELAANKTYQTLASEMAYPQGGHFGNQDGNSILVSPNGLPLYVPNASEAGTFSNVKNQKTPFQGESDVFNFERAGAGSYSAPREVEIAKALNAHLVKAWYLVGFGQTTAETGWDSQTTRTQTHGNIQSTTWRMASSNTSATAQMYLRDEQTRIAIRSPDGDTRYARESSRKSALKGGYRPWDGDVVVRLDEVVLGVAPFIAPGGVQKDEPASSGALGAVASIFGALGGPSRTAGSSSTSYTTRVDPDKFAEASTELVTAVQSRLVQKLKP